MASAFDDLLGNLAARLKKVGIGSGKTAAQNRAEIDYMTPSNRAAQAGQSTMTGTPEFYDMSRRTDYTYKPREYDRTIPMDRGMLSGAGLGLAAPATSYSSIPTSTTDRGSTGRGMYGMGTTLSEGPLPASEINPLFSGSDMDSIIEAGGRATDNSSVFTTTDAQTGKEVVVDGYGNAFFLPPKTTTRPGFEDENGNLNLPGMLSYALGSDGRGALLDEENPAGVGYARDVEGNPLTFIAEGIGGMLSDMDERANPGNVRDQTVRAGRADNARDVAEEKIRIEQMMMQGAISTGLTPREAQRQVKSQQGQRRVEEEQLKRKQERDLSLLRTGNLPGREGVETTLDEDMDLEIQRFANKAPKPVEEDQGIVEKIMDLVTSPVYGADVIENAPVNYDAFGNVVSQPETEVLMSRQAQIVDPVDDRFTNYIERVEGFKTGKGKTPFRYESPEGGLDTVGLGHKLTQDEIDSNSVYGFDLDTLTKEQSKEIFSQDLIKYEKMLKSDLKTNYKKYEMEQPIDYDTLNRKQQEILLDFTFNLGSLKGFPKFTEAVLKGDMDTARKEYKRYYKQNGKNK
jgi:GH24 family phage-related lysozyme (muramidase)